MAREWLTAAEAAKQLGVKPETLYAYVSRGVVRSERVPGARRSRYLRQDVERHAARRRAGGRAGGLDIHVETQLTHLDPAGGLSYRGWDVERAAQSASFEEVASWLWLGDRTARPFSTTDALRATARRAARAVPDHAAIDQVRVAVAALRAADPLRDDRRPIAVASTGRAIIGAVLDVPSLLGAPAAEGANAAARLWPRVSAVPPTSRSLRLLNATLVLLADHELAASTLAARVAASTWADPYLVVAAGLAALGGPLHGGASEPARQLVREVRDDGVPAPEAVGDRLRGGGRIPGFGHSVYLNGDPRARVLLAMTPQRSSTAAAARRILATTEARALPFPNIDFALAVMAESYDMVAGATELVFAIARIVGWLAHAIEEYEHRLRFRPRAIYTGPASAAP